jgi:drug/metabolite transporter (DMT)-like permease
MPQTPIPAEDRRPIDRNAAAIMVVLCMIWGTQQAVIKIAAPDMSPVLQLGIRSTVAALATLILARVRGETGWLRRDTAIPGLLVGLFFGLEFACAGEALRYTSASHVTVYLYSAPILIAAGLGLSHRDERLRPDQWLGVLIAFAGVVASFLGRGDPGTYPAMRFGDMLALAAAAAWASTALVLRGSKLANAPATVTLFYQLTGAAIEASVIALALGETTVHPGPRLAMALGWQIVVVAFCSYLTWFALLRRYSSARLGVLSFMTPVFGVAAGVVRLGDRIDTGFGVGAAMILGGVILATTGLRRRRRA